jgi:hypothetical protein
MTAAALIADVCNANNVSVTRFLDRNHRPESMIVLRRQVARTLRHGWGWSLPRIGKAMSRNHASVMNLLAWEPNISAGEARIDDWVQDTAS